MDFKVYECINTFGQQFDDANENDRPYIFQVGELYKAAFIEDEWVDGAFRIEVIFQRKKHYITMGKQTFEMVFRRF